MFWSDIPFIIDIKQYSSVWSLGLFLKRSYNYIYMYIYYAKVHLITDARAAVVIM